MSEVVFMFFVWRANMNLILPLHTHTHTVDFNGKEMRL